MQTVDCVVIGSGPAGLTAATILTEARKKIFIIERRGGPAWRLLVAGASGLNVSFESEDLSKHYFSRQGQIASCLNRFGQRDWFDLLKNLGEEVYLGSSRRYFIRNHQAAKLTQSWVDALQKHGAQFLFGREAIDFFPTQVMLDNGETISTRAIIWAAGGASWLEQIPGWWTLWEKKSLKIHAPGPSNVGYEIAAPKDFFSRSQGLAVKGAILHTQKGSRQGEFMITQYGLEGTPVYSHGCVGPAFLDLKPEMTLEQLTFRFGQTKGSPRKVVQRTSRLSPGAMALLEALAPNSAWESRDRIAATIKHLPITFTAPRPLREAISTSGGVSWDELNEDLECKKIPGVFCAGEMIDWDAPTGGFLLQACVSTGAVAALGVLKQLESK